MRSPALLTLTSVILGTLVGCSLFSPKVTERKIVTIAPPSLHLDFHDGTGCLSMMKEYCDALYSPESRGNLIIERRKGTPIHILQGKTKNGFNQVFYELAQSRIRNQRALPFDFYSILKTHQYFQKLETLIRRDPFEKMNIVDRIESTEQEAEVDHLWDLAIKKTLMTRISREFPEYPKTQDDLLPPEIGHFERLERRTLLSEISGAIWKDHPNWKKVSSTFETLRGLYLKTLDRLPLESLTRENWKVRIKSITLVPPGSIPEIADQDCSSTNTNAYYYTNYNVITVCAGDFNSEDIALTLAHEMSHALDNDRSLSLFFKQSQAAFGLEKINAQLCGKTHTVNCKEWNQFKSQIPDLSQKLSTFEVTLPEFNTCLKKDQDTRELDVKNITRFAERSVRDRIRGLADEEAFLRVIKSHLPLPNGKKVRNPSHHDPCHYLQSKWEEEDLDGDLSMLTVFLSEYQCSTEKDPSQRIKNSISETQSIFTAIEKGMITSEGEFSSRRAMIEEDFSSPPSERFADVMGSYVMADYLSQQQSLWDRRISFLSSNSWQCTGPSLSTAFPKETSIIRKYLQEAHTDGDVRKKEFLTTPIQQVLSCEKDFEWDECEIDE